MRKRQLKYRRNFRLLRIDLFLLSLLKDKERTLLLALLLLLYNEGGSAELLFALFYLLI